MTVVDLYAPDEVPEDVNARLVRRVEQLERDIERYGAAFQRIGLIGNDALKSPLEIRAAANYVTGFGLPGTNSILASVDLAIPDGFTNGVVFVAAMNSYLGVVGSGNSYVRAQAGAAGTWGRASTAYLYATDAISVGAFAVVPLTGLSGGVVTAHSAGYALAGAKPAVASNTADVSVIGFFAR